MECIESEEYERQEMQTVDSAKLAQAKFSFDEESRFFNTLFFYVKSLCLFLNGEEYVRKEMQTVDSSWERKLFI